jgi:hypothetical protein
MARFKFECPHCRAEVATVQGELYVCGCGWQGRYPTAREQLELTPGESPIDMGARRAV